MRRITILILMLFLWGGAAQADTFGKTTAGNDGVYNAEDWLCVCGFYSPASNGDLDSLTVQYNAWAAPITAKGRLVIYSYSGGTATLVDSTAETSIDAALGGWLSVPVVEGASVTTGTVYMIGFVTDVDAGADMQLKYSTGANNDSLYRISLDYSTSGLPATISSWTFENYNVGAAYATYTASGGEAIKRRPATIDDWIPEGAYIK